MGTHSTVYHDYMVTVETKQNERSAWIFDLRAEGPGGKIARSSEQQVTTAWLTEAEALEAALEEARLLIDRLHEQHE